MEPKKGDVVKVKQLNGKIVRATVVSVQGSNSICVRKPDGVITDCPAEANRDGVHEAYYGD